MAQDLGPASVPILPTASSQQPRAAELMEWFNACGDHDEFRAKRVRDAMTLNISTSGWDFDVIVEHGFDALSSLRSVKALVDDDSVLRVVNGPSNLQRIA